MAYHRGDYIAFGVREILLYGLLIGAVFFGFGWVARPMLDDRVAVLADEGPIHRYSDGSSRLGDRSVAEARLSLHFGGNA